MLDAVEIERPYYLCPACHQGQLPFDRELDVENTHYSPGVRRMIALVGSESSFESGREQLQLLAGLDVTANAVERGAEAIGADLAAREQQQIQRAVQLPLPQVAGADIPVLYIEMDGTWVPMVAAETAGRAGKSDSERARTREVKLGCVFTQPECEQDGRPLREEASTSYTGAIEGAEEFGRRLWQQAWERGRGRSLLALARRPTWPSPPVNKVGPRNELFHGSIARPASASVNASPAMSPPPAHDSRSTWFAIPSLWGSFLPDSLPVYPGAF